MVNEKDILLQNAFYATFGFKEKNTKEYRLFMTSELMVFCEVVHKSHSNDVYIFRDAFKLSECFLTFCYVDVLPERTTRDRSQVPIPPPPLAIYTSPSLFPLCRVPLYESRYVR